MKSIKSMNYPIVTSILVLTMLSGCAQAKSASITQPPAGSETATQPQTPAPSNPQQKQKDVLKQFQVIVSQAIEARDVTAFLDQNMSKVDAQTADQNGFRVSNHR